MITYIDELPEELSLIIYQLYLQDIIKSDLFRQKLEENHVRYLQRTLSRKQLEHLGLLYYNLSK